MASVTEQDIYEVTKELGPDELQHLFHNLGLKQRDIQNEERAADTTDPRLKANKVLLWWRQSKGHEATRDALYEAKGNALRETKQFTDVDVWRKRLKAKYKQDKSTIRFGRHWTHLAETDDIFVDLTLHEERQTHFYAETETGIPNCGSRTLGSYFDLFHLYFESEDRRSVVHHILLQGPAGIGKTTLISRFAYLWAKYENKSDCDSLYKDGMPWDIFELVFLIKLKDLGNKESLEKTIKNQMLCDISEEQIVSVLSKLGSKCLILLDGYDEIPKDVRAQALDSPLLSECSVIATTRPHLVDQFCQNDVRSQYAHVTVSGFSLLNSKEYIRKFFNCTRQQDVGKCLINKIEEIPALEPLSSYPVLLVMLCVLWNYSPDIREYQFYSLTMLFEKAVKYLNKPFQKQSDLTSDILENVLIKLGKPALEARFNNKNRIRSISFDEETREHGFRIGVLVEEEEFLEASVAFIHMTFQEYCAAKYLSNLLQSNDEQFFIELKKVTLGNLFDMEYVLLFCCGLSIDAARAILNHTIGLISPIKYMEEKMWSAPLSMLYEAENYNTRQSKGTTTTQLHNELVPLIIANSKNEIRVLGMTGLALSYLALSCSKNSHMWLKHIENIVLIDCTVNTYTLIRLLGSMPTVTSVNLDWVKLRGELDDDTSVDCKLLAEFTMEDMSVSANIMIRLLECMQEVKSVKLQEVILDGDINQHISVSCNSLTKFNMRWGSIRTNTLMKLLACMLEVTRVTLDKVALEGEISEIMPVSCKSLTVFTMIYASISVNTLTGLLCCMPSVIFVTLREITLVGEIDENIQVSCKSVNEFIMADSSLSAKTIIRLFKGMPAVKSITLSVVTLEGEVGDTTLECCGLLEEFTMTYASISANTLTGLLCCMSSVKSVTLRGISLEGEINENIHVSCKSVTEVTMSHKSLLSAKAIMRLFKGMPAVKSITLSDVTFEGEIDETMLISCKSVALFIMRECSLRANTVMKLLSCIPSVRTVTLDKMALDGEVDENVLGCVELLEKFTMRYVSASSNTITTLLKCMQSARSVILDEVTLDGDKVTKMSLFRESLEITEFILKGTSMTASNMMKLIGSRLSITSVILCKATLEGEVDENMLVLCNSLTVLLMIECSLRANTMMKLLGCMPSVRSVTLDEVTLDGEVDKNISVSCKSLTVFTMRNRCLLKKNTAMKLFGCMPSIRSVTLDKITLYCEVDDDILRCCGLVKEFKDENMLVSCNLLTILLMIECSLRANTMLRLLGCIPSVKTVILHEVALDGKVDGNISILCKSLTLFSLRECSVCSNTAMKLLGCMPSVKFVILRDVILDGDVDENILGCFKFLKEFTMRYVSAKVNTIITLLKCMQSATSVKLDEVTLDGVIVEKIYLSRKSFEDTEFTLKGTSMSASEIMKLLGSTQSITSLTLSKVTLEGEVDENILLSLMSLTKLRKQKEEEEEEEEEEDIQDETFSCRGFKSLTEFTMRECSLSATTIIKLIKYMSSVKSITLDEVTLDGELDETISVSCKSLNLFSIRGCSLSANSMIKMLGCMPSVKSVILDEVTLDGEVDKNISVSCKSLTVFTMRNRCLVRKHTPMKLLGCMPSVRSVTLDKITLYGEVDDDILRCCGLVKEFTMIYESSNSNTITTLLKCMQLATSEKLDEVTLYCDTVKRMSLFRDPLKVNEFTLKGTSMSASKFMKLLGSTLSITSVTLSKAMLGGEVDENMLVSCNSLTILLMIECSLRANTMLRLLGCIPSVKTVILHEVALDGKVDGNISILCKSLTLFSLRECSVCSNTAMKLLGCMPSVKFVILRDVILDGDVDENILGCFKFLKEFTMRYVSAKVNTIITLLKCMQSATSVKLDEVTLDGVIVEKIYLSRKSFEDTEFTLKGTSMSASEIMKLLGSTQSITSLTLSKVTLEGEVDENILLSLMSLTKLRKQKEEEEEEEEEEDIQDETFSCRGFKSLTEFTMRECSLSATTIIKLIKYMSSVKSITLDEVTLDGELDETISVSCKSLNLFSTRECSLSANTMIKLLGCMPSVKSLILNELTLDGEVDKNISVSCKSLTLFSMSECSLCANTAMKLLDCMPSVTFDGMILTSQNPKEDDNMLVSIKSRTEFKDEQEEMKEEGIQGEQFSHAHRRIQSVTEFTMTKCSLSATTTIQLLEYMSSVRSVILRKVTLEGEVDKNISVSCTAITITLFTMIRSRLSANTMMEILACMPSVKSVLLDKVTLDGEVDEDISISCTALTLFTMIGNKLNANTMMKLLDCMPSVRSVTFSGMTLDSEVDKNISVSCKSLTVFEITNWCWLSANTMMRLLGCMPSVRSVTLDKVTLDGEVDEKILVSCKSLTVFEITNWCWLSANTMMRLLDCMPSVRSVSLDKVTLDGVVHENILGCGELLKKFTMRYVSATANTITRLLKWTLSATSMKLDEVKLDGVIVKNIYLCRKSFEVTEFTLKGTSMSANKMMKLLGSRLPITSVTLRKVTLEGEVDENMLVSCKSLTVLLMKECSLPANTMLILIGCMPSVRSVTLDEVTLDGEVDENMLVSYKSLTVLLLNECSLRANTMLKLLGCMPSVRSVTLYMVTIDGEVDEKILVSCKSLTIFTMSDSFVSANTMMRLLGYMPLVRSVRFDDMIFVDEVDESISISCKSLISFTMRECSLSANTMARLLGCMSSVRSVAFDGVTLYGEVEEKILITEFKMGHKLMSPNIIMTLLGWMPSVKSITTSKVMLPGELDMSISFKSLTTFTMRKYSVSVNTVIRLFLCMPSVKSVTLDTVLVTDGVDDGLVLYCWSLTSFRLIKTSASEGTMMRLLECLLPEAMVTLNDFQIKDSDGANVSTSFGYQTETEHGIVWFGSIGTLKKMLHGTP